MSSMIEVTVALASGRSESLSILESSKEDLNKLAQKSFGQGSLRLATAAGCILSDPMQTLQAAGLQDGDQLTAIVGRAKLASNRQAFAAWCCGGDGVVTWGHRDWGGDSSAVLDQLRNVQQVQATKAAFAAILQNGSVVTWGRAVSGGDSSAVRHLLRGVQQIQATDVAFAAILADGSVVTWGFSAFGGDSSAVQEQLRNVQQVQATSGAFAAILEDGSVVTWGNPSLGGDSSAVQHHLRSWQMAPSLHGGIQIQVVTALQ